MAGILDFLQQAGHVAGQGLGAALTPLAMVEAARGGQNPFDVLNGNALQQQQLQNAQQEGLLKRATALNDPAVRNLLMQQPQLSSQFGIPTEQRAAASANFPMGEQPGAVQPQNAMAGQRQVPMLPERYVSPGEQQKMSQIQGQQALRDFFARSGGLGGGGEGGGVESQGGAPSQTGGGQVMIGGVPYLPVPSFSSSGGMGMSLQPAPAPIRLPAGATANTTGKKIAGRDILEVTPGPTTQTRARQEAAVKIRKQLADVQKQVAGIGSYSPLYASAQSAIREHPGVASVVGQQVDPKWSKMQAAAGVLTTGLMNVHVGARGSEGMMKEFANNIVQSAFQGSDAFNANLQAVNEYLDRVLDKGEDPDTVVADVMGKGPAGGAPAGAPTPSAPAAPASAVPDELKAARDRIRGLGTKTLARAGGGPIPPGQQALVGEAGLPELVQNRGSAGVQVTPLQQQEPRRLGLGPGVSAPYAASPNPAQPQPRQLQAAGGGLGAGTGLSEADTAAARSQRGTITLGPDGLPVFVRQ